MPARDDDKTRRQQIIDGALAVFARFGFKRAANRDIACAAGNGSPGLIYHYFKDKADLLYHVIRERMPLIPLVDRLEQLTGEPLEVVLP